MTRSTRAGHAASYAEYFTDQLRLLAGLEPGAATDRVLAAFRAVAREAFAGPGPWLVHSPLSNVSLPPQWTPDDDPRWLYHDVLVVLDEAKGINIGEPALWARLFAHLDVRPGSRILQVGAGVGYYTAILDRLTGPAGSVVAYEIEAELVLRATVNLADRKGIEVRQGNAATDLSADRPFDLVVAFAGVTHVPDLWASHLAPNARLLLPLTGRGGWGAMALASRCEGGFEAVTLGRCGFYPCEGARDAALADRLDDLLCDSARSSGGRLRIISDHGRVRIETADA